MAGVVGEHWGKFEDAGIDKVKAESNHEVYKLTPEQTAAWKKAADPLVKTWEKAPRRPAPIPTRRLAS